MIEKILFALLSIGALLLSWPFLANPRSHGFYRFFAFECLLAITLLSVEGWFEAPFTPLHILSWLFLAISSFLALHGFFLLRKHGKPEDSIDHTTKLVQKGAYRYIRHPLYASLLLFGWGAYLKSPQWLTSALVIAASILLFLTSWMEEKLNRAKFGEAYEEYMKETKRLIPFLL